jgi:hypothetical protein
MCRPRFWSDIGIGLLGLVTLCAIGALGFAIGSDVVPPNFKWVAALCLLLIAGASSALATWLACRRNYAWLRSRSKDENVGEGEISVECG